MKRRDFLKQTSLASGTLFIPSFLKPLEALALNNLSGHKNLVVIQLSGGNDGMNTLIPYGIDEYYKYRKSIALKDNELIKLNHQQGLNANMEALRDIYDDGAMAILNSVGYPNPDRSHFRSMDIWHTASDADQYLSTGWIGRYLDSNCQECSFPYAAIEVDDTLSLAMKGYKIKGIAVQDPQQLYKNTRDPFFREVINDNKEMLDEDNLGYLYKTMIETSSSAKYILEKSKTYKNLASYPAGVFGNQLKTVAKFINSGLATRVYYVSLSGFDTHTNQLNQQGRLLKQYSEGISAFVKDLKTSGNFKDTLILTFSEFGRRVQQNASGGTDHGTANNIFLFGGSLKKQGILNQAPNLTDLDNGDLKYEIDFRQVYATLLDKWLDVDNANVLNKKFSSLDFI